VVEGHRDQASARPAGGEPLTSVDPLSHPAIERLVQQTRRPERLVRRASVLVNWLMGVVESPQPADDRWLDAFLERAWSDLGVVRLLCRGRPLRALSAAAALLVELHIEDEDEDDDDNHDEQDDTDDDEREEESEQETEDQDTEDPDDAQDQDEPAEPELDWEPELLDADGLMPPGAGGIEADFFLGPDRRQGIQGALQAAEECAQLEDLLGSLLPSHGWDYTSGTLERMLMGRFELFERLLRGSAELKRLADLLGRIERSDRQAAAETGFGKEQVVGVRLGGDLEDVLPAEWALLGDASTEDLFYQRFAERRLMTLEVRGDDEDEEDPAEGRGPIIACVDTSGSMRGAPEEMAKALVLSIARRALKQRRHVHVMLFGGKDDLIHLQLRGGVRGLDQLLDFLLGSFHAGTDFDGPLMAALDMTDKPSFSRADILVVTDGLCRAGPAVVTECNKAKQETGLSIASVVIVGPHGAELTGVSAFSDRVFALDPRDPGADPVTYLRQRGG